MFLADTNLLSETWRAKPNERVVQWFNRNFSNCAISSVAIFELENGIRSLAHGSRRTELAENVGRLIKRFGPRNFVFDTSAALMAAELRQLAQERGLSLHQIPQKLADLQIAGIAAANGLTLATRNTADFEGLGIALENPWAS
jgi:predicted nucleic acid-binding protein